MAGRSRFGARLGWSCAALLLVFGDGCKRPVACEGCQSCCADDEARCSPSTCDGCCAEDGSCVHSGEGDRCGQAGERCRPWEVEAAQRIGQGCLLDSDCASVGAGALCKRETAGKATYDGGYCTRPCSAEQPCPFGTVCARPGFGEVGSFCLAPCRGDADCRPGYACYVLALQSSEAACWLSPLPRTPLAPESPPGLMGQSCRSDADCRMQPPNNGPEQGFCFEEHLPDGGESGFPGGACSAICESDETCGDGGVCVVYGVQAGRWISLCGQRCTPGASVDCRPGYTCRVLSLPLPDGGARPLATGVCEPAHVGSNATPP